MTTSTTTTSFSAADIARLMTEGFAAKLREVLVGAEMVFAMGRDIQIRWADAGSEYEAYVSIWFNEDGTATASVSRAYDGAEMLAEWIRRTGTPIELA